jgi:hypothetical protein
MFVSTIIWRFKPGTSNRVEGLNRERMVPTARGVAGLRDLYAVPLEGDTWLSMLVYDTSAHAEQGLATLVPVAREAFGESLLGTARRAGEAAIAEHFR